MTILAVEGLVRDFGGFRAVDGVDLAVREGSIHAVIGPNGAGKSTLFKLITGNLRPTSGRVTLSGASIGGKRSHVIARRAGTVPNGDQRALETAMALAIKPTVLLREEPTAGMSPPETRATADLIVSETRSRGITVVLSEHDMDVVFGISEHVTVLHQGRVIADGLPQDVRAHPDVMAVYLGHAATQREQP